MFLKLDRNKPKPAAIDAFAADHRSERTKRCSPRSHDMSDAFDYFRAYAVRALCKARLMSHGRMRHLQLLVGRIYNLLKKEAAYDPNIQHLDDFRAAQKLEQSLDCRPEAGSRTQGRLVPAVPQDTRREAG